MKRVLFLVVILLAACSQSDADSRANAFNTNGEEGDLFLEPGERSCRDAEFDGDVWIQVCLHDAGCSYELRGNVLDHEGVTYELSDDERESLIAAARLAVDGLEPGCFMCAPIGDDYDPISVQFQGESARTTYSTCEDFASRRDIFLDAVAALEGPRNTPPNSWSGLCPSDALDDGVLAKVTWGGANNDAASVEVTSVEVSFIETYGAEPAVIQVDETQRDALLAEIDEAAAELRVGCTDCAVEGDHYGYFVVQVGESELRGVQSACDAYGPAVSKVESATRILFE